MGSYVERNLQKEEHVVLVAKTHWAVLIPHILLMFVLVGFLTIWIPLIAFFTTELGFTNKKLIGKVGLIATKSVDSPLNKINNVSVSSGLWGKIFNYGTLHITTSSGAYLFVGVANAEQFKASLMAQVDQFDEDRIKKQATELANAMNK
ncbi:MAG: PH domain-containing protein [Clostridiales bacterium]|jgi:uncharacterized membrane protein YdbT with pleckstrin-like domain|nr:PH domain-containing protein [Clostridiales bacterium]